MDKKRKRGGQPGNLNALNLEWDAGIGGRVWGGQSALWCKAPEGKGGGAEATHSVLRDPKGCCARADGDAVTHRQRRVGRGSKNADTKLFASAFRF